MKRLGCKFSDVATYAMLYSSKTGMMIQDAMIFMEVWRVALGYSGVFENSNNNCSPLSMMESSTLWIPLGND